MSSASSCLTFPITTMLRGPALLFASKEASLSRNASTELQVTDKLKVVPVTLELGGEISSLMAHLQQNRQLVHSRTQPMAIGRAKLHAGSRKLLAICRRCAAIVLKAARKALARVSRTPRPTSQTSCRLYMWLERHPKYRNDG